MRLIFLCCVLFGLTATAAPAMARDWTSPLQVVADAVRQRGFECEKPRNASRDPKDAAPDEAVWTLDCDKAKYRVEFKGDTGAIVTPIGPQ